MAAIRRVDTAPKVALRASLHRLGHRFRKDFPRLNVQVRSVRPDIAFKTRKLAIFVDGCFWPCCPDHGQRPRVNGDYRNPKLKRNVAHDLEQTSLLRDAGGTVLRFWAHEDVDVATAVVHSSTFADA